MRRLPACFDNPARNTVLLGVLLLVLGCVLLAVTEHADRARVMSADALGGFVLTGRAAVPGSASDGHLVLVSGAPEVHTPARDAQFGVATAAPALLRNVEMFQWHETNFGGERSYQQDWIDHPIDSATFNNPVGHQNPGAFPLVAARFDSPDVTVGGFRLATALVDLIPGPEAFTPDLAHIPGNMAATFQADAGTLVTSTNLARPQVGDLRVSWQRIAPAELTVFARDAHGTLVPTQNAAGAPIAEVLIGKVSLADAVAGAPRAPRFRWARRVLALLLAWAGVDLLLPRTRRSDRGLALAAALVPLALIAAGLWFEVRIIVCVALVLLAVLAAIAVGWRWTTHIKRGW
ncbi:MAG TPA: TMEM43 family protein [Rhodanobacteraceae bacterium]